MAPKIDEYDVFKIPHSRMMQLVNSCNKNLHVTDFANNDALFALLSNLHSVFNEFKSHENIENEHIMKKLKSKLKAMAIYNSAVCNCHKDDEFTPLLKLVEMGYMFLDNAKSASERISFGVKLRKALNKFTRIFVPHMKEEEEVFQPLLLKYFSQVELIDMKNTVIKLHMQERKRLISSISQNNSSLIKLKLEKPLVIRSDDLLDPVNTNKDKDVSLSQTRIQELPNEIMLKILDNLTVKEKMKASLVCKRWHELVYDASNWKEMDLSEWTHKKIKDPVNQNFLDEIECQEFENEQATNSSTKVLTFWIKCLLPRVGFHLYKLNLSNCKSLNNNLARKILQLCPNLKQLDLSYTNVGDNSFRGVRLDKLNHLNCEGCDKLTDNAFKNLLITSSLYKYNYFENTQLESQHNKLDLSLSCHNCHGVNLNIEETISKLNSQMLSMNINQMDSIGLVSLNLSGCYLLTDFGLSYIASNYDLNNLDYLNLSGCLNLTSFGLGLFVETSQTLRGDNLYYCDNISDGPMGNEANGCENLQCGSKFCCRTVA